VNKKSAIAAALVSEKMCRNVLANISVHWYRGWAGAMRRVEQPEYWYLLEDFAVHSQWFPLSR
jgi:hypothetical protein